MEEMEKPEELVDWIRTTRDVSTIETIVNKLLLASSREWVPALTQRRAEESDFNPAVELAVTVGRLVGEGWEREFLQAGLENPDTDIREHFEGLLRAMPE
ncbi:MAG: hypothetical protein HYR52_03200, partial [Candidatus Tectomicrobia bacterium]|nr:hypothetical protein [Candidatus Tectomicrobia bacterium]